MTSWFAEPHPQPISLVAPPRDTSTMAESVTRYARLATREELDHLYSPSRWSKRLSADVIVVQHDKILKEATKAAQRDLRCELNIEFEHPGGPTLDVYYPEKHQGHEDVFLYIHGGYWQAFGTEHCGFLAVPFTRNGIVVVALGYDLAPKVNMTTIVEQCRKGCIHVMRAFPRTRIFVGGHSAGAHLAACMLVTDWLQYGMKTPAPFAGAVLLSGIYDLAPIQKTYVNDPIQLTDTEVQQFSPQKTLAQLKLPPGFKCFLANGDQEPPPYKSQVAEYIEGLQSVGVSCSHHEVGGEDHFSLVERMREPEQDYSLNKLIFQYFRDCK